MASLNAIPTKQVNYANEERSTYFPQNQAQQSIPRAPQNVRNAFDKGDSRDRNQDDASVIQVRDEFNGSKQQRMQKQKRKEASRINKLNSGASIGGFLSQLSQDDDIDYLKGSGNTLKDNQEYAEENVEEPVITAS